MSPGYVRGISKKCRTSTERANVDSEVGFKRERRARVTDCQIKALRASSVEMWPEGMVTVFVASNFRAASEAGWKVK